MSRGEITKIIVIIVIFLGSFFVVSSIYLFNNCVNQRFNIDEDLIFTINKGDSVSKTIHDLAKIKIITNPKMTNFSVKILKPKIIFKHGEYLLKNNSNLNEVLNEFAAGKVMQRMILIAEGITVKSVKEILEKEDHLTGEITENILEGFIYPDTYYFETSYDRNKLFKKMSQNMNDFLDKIAKFDEFIKTKEDLVNLASIVEKETKIEEERPMIAAVFLNRLKKKMPLQADPTIIYSISKGKGHIDRSLNYTDLRTDSPYNSYTRIGLPLTPIAIPSISSIKAVLNPAITDNLYFVANNKGGHCFANNLLKHNMNVIKYRKNHEYECN